MYVCMYIMNIFVYIIYKKINDAKADRLVFNRLGCSIGDMKVFLVKSFYDLYAIIKSMEVNCIHHHSSLTTI
jgi:hypothetical protein